MCRKRRTRRLVFTIAKALVSLAGGSTAAVEMIEKAVELCADVASAPSDGAEKQTTVRTRLKMRYPEAPDRLINTIGETGYVLYRHKR